MSVSAVIDATNAAVAADVTNARAVFKAEGRLVGVTEVAIGVRQHRLSIDEPISLGGGDTALNPVEAVLAGLSACQAIVYRFLGDRVGHRHPRRQRGGARRPRLTIA